MANQHIFLQPADAFENLCLFFSPLRKLVPFIVKLWKCSILKLSSLSSLQHSKTSLLTILSPRQRVGKETELTRTHSANAPRYVLRLLGHMAL